MSQPPVTNIDKAAVLLSRLDPQALDKVLAMLGQDFAGKLRPVLAAVARRKDIGQLTAQVMQEFRELQQDVQASVGGAPAVQQRLQSGLHAATVPSPVETGSRGAIAESLKSSKEPTGHVAEGAGSNSAPTGASSSSADVASLANVPPLILAVALKPESPRVIATVLKQLPSDVSGKVLEALPSEQRQTVFLLMADTVQVNPAIVERVLQRLLDVCGSIDPAAAEQQDRRLKTLIGILQAVEREERIRLLETLTARDPELAAQVDDLMYDYTDMLRIEDRSVQKLLGQLEQKVVATALKSAPDELRHKVLKNLSERVRIALSEEMELLSGVNASKTEQARREIANVIRAQDKEGALMWIEE
jgi:flagellar motor switch protein FliG